MHYAHHLEWKKNALCKVSNDLTKYHLGADSVDLLACLIYRLNFIAYPLKAMIGAVEQKVSGLRDHCIQEIYTLNAYYIAWSPTTKVYEHFVEPSLAMSAYHFK